MNIPYGQQDISAEDIEAVVEVLQSNFLTQGPQVPNFEGAVQEYTSAAYAVACNSATSALHLACLALGVGPGDRVWTSPITFVASANCALYCGADIDFVDIEADSFNLSVDALQLKLIAAAAANSLPKVVIVVHMAGHCAAMQAIHALSEAYGFSIIEDASHAIGAHYQQQPVGNCRYSDITVFSFHPVKIITTAEGGVATTACAELAAKMRLYRSHGVTSDRKLISHSEEGSWYYEQQLLGYNYRMTELQAALGCSQIKRLNQYVRKRHDLAQRYDQLLQELPLELPLMSSDVYSSYHLYIIRLKKDNEQQRLPLFEHLRSHGIGVNVHYIPVHLQPYYQRMGFARGDFPVAEDYYQRAISIPLHPRMTEVEQNFIVQQLEAVL